METNTQQAIYIAVNLLIFITLLTVALSLLTASLNISKRAADIISDSSASYVSVLTEEQEEGYVYTYTDLLSIYAKNANKREQLDMYHVSFDPTTTVTLSTYIANITDNYYNPIDEYLRKYSLLVSEEVVNGKLLTKYTFQVHP